MQNGDINLPPISNYFDPNIRDNQNFVPQPLILQQQAATPRRTPPLPNRPLRYLPLPCHSPLTPTILILTCPFAT